MKICETDEYIMYGDFNNEERRVIEFNVRRENYNTFPYGLWFPKPTEYRVINLVQRYINVLPHIDGDVLYIGSERVRTPNDSSSRPCANCGHYIDNGHTIFCKNTNCKRDRKQRGLCEKEYHSNQTWIHKFEYSYTIQKRGMVFRTATCKWCLKTMRWLDDYKQLYPSPKLSKRINFFRTRIQFSGKIRHIVLQKFSYRCVECGATKDETSLHIDHIKPISKGGTNDLDNLQVLCKKCNLSKHTDEWVGGQ